MREPQSHKQLPCGDGLYRPFMVFFGMVYSWANTTLNKKNGGLYMNMLLKVGNDPQKKLAGFGSHNFESPLNWLIYVFASWPPGFLGFTVAFHVRI